MVTAQQLPSPRTASIPVLNFSRLSRGTKAWAVPAKPPPCTRTAPRPSSSRSARADAFRSATGDIYERRVLKTDCGPQIFKVYCRDNNAPGGAISRELVKETVREDTNSYRKLANISFTKEGGVFSYDNLVSDPHVDPLPYCLEAQRLFDLYQNCIGRRQPETLLENYVESMQAVKIARGHIYFVPRDYMAKLTLFEDFIELLEQTNQFTLTLAFNWEAVSSVSFWSRSTRSLYTALWTAGRQGSQG